MSDQKKITLNPLVTDLDQQVETLTRGIVDLFTEEELTARLKKSIETNTPLTVKVGFDPTAPDIHLGHAVLIRKMAHFQKMGHRVIFLIGDFTGMIGDPTGKSKTRPPLTREEILANAETYKRQCFKILDPDATEIRFNNEWFAEMNTEGVMRLMAKYNVARMLERNDFKSRYQAGKQIAIHEFLYPLAQAYDSVALEADVELGGTDQLFNLNVGRDIMPAYGLKPQLILTTPLLEGLDGVEKMSKSMGNYVGIMEEPGEMFGKLMSISDDMMWKYYELCTELSLDGIDQMQVLVEEGSLHPKKAKEGLALRIITDYHGEDAAQAALQGFRAMFEKKEIPDEIPEKEVEAGEGSWPIGKLLCQVGLAGSNGEGNRLVKGGGVQADGVKLDSGTREFRCSAGDVVVFKAGKRRFVRVTFI
jgi:tyrosyl-tRNA synthetase